MNYIKQLEEDRKNLALKVANIMIEISAFQAFLHSDKFTGFDSNGDRKDWIATKDVLARLQEIKNLI